jgi:hypothetical protein
MPKRSSKGRDMNTLASRIVSEATGDAPPDESGKNPAAVALGRLGGQKGGKARADSLSSERRREIAQNAARARWRATG